VVLTAINGPLGLEIFAARAYRGSILDYSMPGMDGGEVSRAACGRSSRCSDPAALGLRRAPRPE